MASGGRSVATKKTRNAPAVVFLIVSSANDSSRQRAACRAAPADDQRQLDFARTCYVMVRLGVPELLGSGRRSVPRSLRPAQGHTRHRCGDF